MAKFRSFLPAFFYYILITIFSAQTRLSVPSLFPFIDKVLHFILYAGFGVCLSWGFFRLDPRRGRKGLGLILVFGALLSGLDEIHQIFVPGRHAEIGDWIVDVLGILAGWGIVRLARRLRPTRSPRR